MRRRNRLSPLILMLALSIPWLFQGVDASTVANKTVAKPLVERVGDVFRNLAGLFAHRLPTPAYVMNAPKFDASPFPSAKADAIAQKFCCGQAGAAQPLDLLRAGVFKYDPLQGGIYKRRDTVHYIIMHSTETAHVADAVQIIHSWNERGLRHAGAQFIIERNGQIYMTLDPHWACVHVEPTRTLFGVNNDNSVGVEIVHTGDQHYTPSQLQSVERLICYLKEHFKVKDSDVLAHKTVQPSDRHDPVDFNWHAFWSAEAKLHS